MGFFEKLKNGLTKTKNVMVAPIDSLFKKFVKVDEELLDELEEILIEADVGVDVTMGILDELRDQIRSERTDDPARVRELLTDILISKIGNGEEINMSTTPAVVLVIGVNGVGKTTSIAKIANSLKSNGKKVVLAAADTFRAAAIDQLGIWADRIGVEMIAQKEGSDPGAVVYDAIGAAKNRNADVLIIDTAGRLHNKKNLMDELSKINRIIDRELPGCARDTLLVLDATTGNNAVSQAKEFKKAAPITGLVLTKLDGTAKGGIVFSVKEELGIPIKYIGVGEQVDDLQPFNSEEFVKAMFE